ncbi:MAG: polymerase sigma-70 factor, subfamily, partial [Solirubrobacteraceae bacterium]|nr:polymerase sigma-70 factor, subfamily [Solirubrobacteraceae bacterium]
DAAAIRSAEAFLVTVTTRLAIDRLRSARVRREAYVGPWLPEPLLADAAAPDPADVVAEAEQISLAVLVMLERLNPVERAVLLLRDVFDLDYGEIADVVGKSPANVRQIARRARGHVGEVGRRAAQPTPDYDQRLIGAFMEAVSTGDLERLTGLLAADAIMWSDGGGVVRAARKPIHSAQNVGRFFIGVARKMPPGVAFAWVRVNGEPGLLVATPEGPIAVVAFEIGDGLIVGVRVVSNPEKLGYAARWTDSRRARSSSSSSTSRRMS